MKQDDFEKYALSAIRNSAKRLEKQYPQGNYLFDFKDIERLWHPDLTKKQYLGLIAGYTQMFFNYNTNKYSSLSMAAEAASIKLSLFTEPTFNDFREKMYSARRDIHYPHKCKDKDDIFKDFLNTSTKDMEIVDKGDWRFRKPKNRTQKGWTTSDIQERLVANMHLDMDVMKRLDQFCCEHKCYYKTPESSKINHRLDTVIIYSHDKISEENKQEFIDIVSPYIRKEIPYRTNTIDGILIAEGVSVAKELNDRESLELIDSLSCSEKEKQVLTDNATSGNKHEAKLSLGQYTILQELSNLIEKFYPEQQDSQKKQTQQDAVLNSFDVYQDKQSNDFIFVAKSGGKLEVFEKKLTDLGLDIKGGYDDGTGRRSFKAKNTPNNRRITISLLNRKKQSEHEKSSPKKTSRIGAILNTLQTNDVFLSKDSKGRDLFVFVPKEGISRADALGAVHKMKEAGMNITAGALDKDKKPLYTTDPNVNDTNQNEWIMLLKQHMGRKQ